MLIETSTVPGIPVDPLYKRPKGERIIGEIGKNERKLER